MAKKNKVALTFNEYVSIDARGARVYAAWLANSPSIERGKGEFVMQYKDLKETVSREVSFEKVNEVWVAFVAKCEALAKEGK